VFPPLLPESLFSRFPPAKTGETMRLNPRTRKKKARSMEVFFFPRIIILLRTAVMGPTLTGDCDDRTAV
jgi:hypothetical protein